MVTFNFSFQPGMSLQQMIGFEIAGRVWGQYLTDNATVNIHVGMGNLANGILGGSIPAFKTGQTLSGFKSALAADATSADDRTVVSNIGSSGVFSTEFNLRKTLLGLQLKKDVPIVGSSLSLTTANAKALGGAASSNLDGYIVLNNAVKTTSGTAVPWNTNSTSTAVPTNTIDLVSTAIHEIGHVLGFVSSVDRPWKVAPVDNILTVGAFRISALERANQSTPLDFFRTDSSTFGKSNLSEGGDPYLDLDPTSIGSNKVGSFATGVNTTYGGSGSQASHWRGDSGSSGLMNASLRTGVRSKVESIDLRAFDTIGWNLASSGVNTALDWTSLQNQAKQALADRMGQTTAWLDSNATSAANLLGVDRFNDVIAMIAASSDIYEGRSNSNGNSWQALFDLLSQEGLQEKLEDDSITHPKATRQSDNLLGTTERDVLSGLGGNDQLIGFAGNDQLRGNKGSDLLMGNLGRDLLLGGDGKDTLVGGKGCDTLMGGNGSDLFVVQNKPGIDQVMDFTDGQDKLMLANDLKFGQLSITQQGQDVLISSSTTALMLLHNVSSSLITKADIA
jgi:Ca2+-binding RTX toxin-like protein